MHYGPTQEAGLHASIPETWFHSTPPTTQTGIRFTQIKYNLVFGSFVGVNHPGQSTLLGCTLMKNEDIQSFKWLFECFLRCVGGKAPKDILTDQCASKQRAIEMCMPTTIHWWYI
ncbi:hypothetical protein Ahy_A06g026035 [Arachis hypogaea]|uniref:MULE transposase domain-containing protein n=1 Tax=Arachis hypogaea TaxID=3818 RepID=A0A445CJ79_ARAHY|nr:hypothetical protein Ahy_A06g026035 [Arachis hypogaea]